MATQLPPSVEDYWLRSDLTLASSPRLSEAQEDNKVRQLERELSDQFQEAYIFRRGHAVKEQQLAEAIQRAAEEAALAKRIKVSLQKKLEAAESHAAELHDKLQHLRLQHQKERELFCRERQVNQATCCALEMQLDEKQEELAAARQHMELSRRELSETQAEAQCELANLEDVLQAAEAEIAILELALADAEADKAALAGQLFHAQQKLTATQKELAAAQEEETITSRLRLEELERVQAESAARVDALAQVQAELAQANEHYANQAACLLQAQGELRTVEFGKAALFQQLKAVHESEMKSVAQLMEERQQGISAALEEIDEAILEGLQEEDDAMLKELEALAAPRGHLAHAQSCCREELRALKEVLASFDEALAIGSVPASTSTYQQDAKPTAQPLKQPVKSVANAPTKLKTKRRLRAAMKSAVEVGSTLDERYPCPDIEPPPPTSGRESTYVEGTNSIAGNSPARNSAQFDIVLRVLANGDCKCQDYFKKAERLISIMLDDAYAQGIQPSVALIHDTVITALQATVEDKTAQGGALSPAATEMAELPRKPAKTQAMLSETLPKLDHTSRLPGNTAHIFSSDDQQEGCKDIKHPCTTCTRCKCNCEDLVFKAAPVEPAEPEGRRILRNKNAMLEKDCKRLAQKLQATEAEKDKLTRKLKEAENSASESQFPRTKEKRKCRAD